MFIIEDELHAEPQNGEFSTLELAQAELRNRASIPWDEKPNIAPCTNWRNCGRRYEIVEYDTSTTPWTVLSRRIVLDVSAEGVRWHPR